MKKIIILLIYVVMTFCFVSCRSDLPLVPDSNVKTDRYNFKELDIDIIAFYNDIFSKLDEAQKQIFTNSVTEDGGSVRFRPDGTTIVEMPEAGKFTQYTDGSVIIEYSDGYVLKGQTNCPWQKNEYTEYIPEPKNLGVVYSAELYDTENFSYIISYKCTLKQAREYRDELASFGFDLDKLDYTYPEEIYYCAYNEDGIEAVYYYWNGIAEISLVFETGSDYELVDDDTFDGRTMPDNRFTSFLPDIGDMTAGFAGWILPEGETDIKLAYGYLLMIECDAKEAENYTTKLEKMLTDCRSYSSGSGIMMNGYYNDEKSSFYTEITYYGDSGDYWIYVEETTY